MPFVEITPSDLLRDKIVEPAWYRLKINSTGEWTPTKDQQSNNCLVDCTIQFNADTGDTEYAGVPAQIQFNDKPGAQTFIRGYLRALGVELQPGRIDLAAANGADIDAYVENETYEGRVRNRINHKYRTPKK